ncbi:MFS transporter [Tsukamurella soli]|uniref:DHA2 family efflux MFS transporter permease subunit n=1 Tax=Tsukamurella soli TaxID=644556 RepID=A0ABP8J179_9ACTN
MSISTTRARSPWAALGVLALAMLVIGLDAMVLTVALPSLSRELGATTSQLQWVTTVYPLVLGAFMVPFGALGDRLGRSRLLALSLLGFGAASALCAFSGSAAMLVVGRALLGLCAAAAMPLSMAVLPGLFPDPHERQRAMGVWMASSALGLPLGPILGGLLLRHFWWGSVFLINVPVAAVGAVAVWLMVPDSRGTVVPGARLDIPGVALSVVGFGSLVYAFTEAGERGWTSARFVGWLAVAVALLVLFVWRQLTTPHPLVRLELLRRRGFLAGTVLASATMLLLSGATFQLSQEFSAAFDADALGVGLRLLPIVGALIVGTRISDMAGRRLGRRTVAMASCVLLLAACGVQAVVADGSYGVYAIMSVLLGLGLGGVIPMAMAMATMDLDDSDAGSGSALLQAIRQIASALGVAVLGSAVAAAYGARLVGVTMPASVRAAAQGGVVAGTTSARRVAPDSVAGIVGAYQHGLAMSALVGCGVSVVLVALCLLIPAQSARGPADAEAGEHDEAARTA